VKRAHEVLHVELTARRVRLLFGLEPEMPENGTESHSQQYN